MKIDGRKTVSLEAREKRRVKALAWWERARNIARYYPCTPKEASGVMQELRFEPWLLEMLETGVPWAIKKHSDLPVDFQIQRMTQANIEHEGKKRSALGIYYADPDPKEAT
jgi:hypothetical protein